MASYIENYKSTNNILNPFKRLEGFPMDITSMFSSADDARKYASYILTGEVTDSRGLGGTAYVGQIISVYENDKVSVYKINADGTLGSIGGTDTKSATSYTQAVTVSQDCAVGQLIKITSSTGSTTDAQGNLYADGFYIVTSPGSILSLSTSSGNISDDEVAALQAALRSLNDKFNNLTADIYNEVEGEDGQKTQVLDVYTKSEIDTKTSTLETAINSKVDAGALNQVSQNLSTLQGVVDGKASTADLNAVSGRVTELENAASDYVTDGELTTALGDYHTKEEAAKVFAPLAAVKNYKITKDTSNGAYAAVYKLTLSDGSSVQDSVDINIPKDMVVAGGSVKYVETEGQPYAEAIVGDAYIELTLQNTNAPIYIPAKSLVDIYTSGDDYIKVDGQTNKITLNTTVLEALVSSKISTALNGYTNTTEMNNLISSAESRAKTYADTAAGTAKSEAISEINTTLEGYTKSSDFEAYKTSEKNLTDSLTNRIGDVETASSNNGTAITAIQNQLAGNTGSTLLTKINDNADDIKALDELLNTEGTGLVDKLDTLTITVSGLTTDAIKTITLASGAQVTKTGNNVTIPVVTTLTGLDAETKKAPISAGAVDTIINGLSNTINSKVSIELSNGLPEVETAKLNTIYIVDNGSTKTEYVKLSEDATALYALGSDTYAKKNIMASYSTDENDLLAGVTNGLMTGSDKYKLDNIQALTTAEVASVLV
jgi:hypothetical protein